jgi:hypothetical protein
MTEGGEGTSTQLQTVLDAIRGIERNNQTTVAAMEKAFDEKLEGLRRDLSEKQERACDKLSQKMKEKEKYQFKRKGNELQHAFNEGIKESIDEALPLLDNPDTAERAKQLLKKGSDMIRERQKLIKIADRSDQGWKTADEYEKDPVANDSDDEKRIRKAESAAEKKAVKERQKRQSKSRGFRAYRYPVGQRDQWRPGTGSQASYASGTMLSQQPRLLPYSRRRPEPCFRCGSESHWARDCPLSRAGPPGGPQGQSPSMFAGRRQ